LFTLSPDQQANTKCDAQAEQCGLICQIWNFCSPDNLSLLLFQADVGVLAYRPGLRGRRLSKACLNVTGQSVNGDVQGEGLHGFLLGLRPAIDFLRA
jgi:hypothetical protein